MDDNPGVAAQLVPGSFWVNKQSVDQLVRVTKLVTWRTCPDSVEFVVLGEPGDHELPIKDFLGRFDPVGGDDERVGVPLLKEIGVPREPH